MNDSHFTTGKTKAVRILDTSCAFSLLEAEWETEEVLNAGGPCTWEVGDSWAGGSPQPQTFSPACHNSHVMKGLPIVRMAPSRHLRDTESVLCFLFSSLSR